MRAHEGGYYIRLSVYDRTGAFAAIASRMADRGHLDREHRAAAGRRCRQLGLNRPPRGARAGGHDYPPDHRGRDPQGA